MTENFPDIARLELTLTQAVWHSIDNTAQHAV